MQKRCLLCLVFLIVASAAADDSVIYANDLLLRIRFSSKVEIVRESGSARINSLNVNLSSFPRNTDSQDVVKLTTEGNRDRALLFSFKDPDEWITFGYEAVVRTEEYSPKIKRRILFPAELPDWTRSYTIPTPNIDSDDSRIVILASSLAEGENDLSVVVFNIAEWIQQNINYSLTSITAEASQKASWTLENRYGVCDEITTLFIAMLRAVGIPARYVTGLAYSNLELFRNDFNNHGWAEVFFPGYGWVPYDITYGEYGYVDASHVVMRHSQDSKMPSVKYSWFGEDVDIQAAEPVVEVNVLGSGAPVRKLLDAELEIFQEETAIESYNLLIARISNPNDFYVSSEIAISKTEGLAIISPAKQWILLEPKQEKKLYWLLKVEDLNDDYRYKFPLMVYTSRNATFTTEFSASRYGSFLEMEDLKQLIREEEEEKIYSRKVELNCTAARKVYVSETTDITCRVVNTGNTYVKLSLCFEACEPIGLGISQAFDARFQYRAEKPGLKVLFVNANSSDLSETVSLTMEVFDKPEINITVIDYPERLDFGKKYPLKFSLERSSYSVPEHVRVTLKSGGAVRNWDLENLTKKRDFIINIDSGDFEKVENIFSLIVTYEDGHGRVYEESRELAVTLNNATPIDRIRVFNNKLNYLLQRKDLDSIMLVALAVFIFGVLSGFILRRKQYK